MVRVKIPADSENGPHGLPKAIKKKLTLTFPGSVKICHLAPGLCDLCVWLYESPTGVASLSAGYD